MRRLSFSLVLPALLGGVCPSAAWADRQSEIIGELREEGYDRIEIGTTWLRRVRIVAEGPKGMREIVIDPRNDEILRDYQRDLPAGATARPVEGGRLPHGPPPEGDRPGPDRHPMTGGPRPAGPPPDHPRTDPGAPAGSANGQ